ncbi:MAG: hypothetical protein ACRD44_02460, partial [Bryobacteraceae bacterium]
MRGWHNRSLHETRGVSFGFDVGVDGATVRVARGLAYDAMGRELWLSADWRTPLPVAPGAYLLVVVPNQRAAPRSSCCTSEPGCDCGCGGHGREAGVDLVAESLDAPEGLVIARVTVGDAPPEVESCLRFVRPLSKPRVALGETVRDNTPWEIWSERFTVLGGTSEVAVGVQTRVDTSAAGFTTTPNYFATLASDGWSASSQPRPEFLPAWFAHIAQPGSDHFLFRLLLKDIARRQFLPRTPEAVVASVEPAPQNRLRLRGAGLDEFTVGDPVALLRPRPAHDARATTIRSNEDDILTPSVPLRAGRIVLGNVPRASRVISTRTDGVSVLTVGSSTGLRRHDVLAVFPAAGIPSSARIRKVTGNKLSMSRLMTDAEAAVEYRTGAIANAAKVSGPPVATPAGTVVPMRGDLSQFQADMWVVDIDSPGGPSAPSQIVQVAAAAITLRSATPGLKPSSRLVPLGPAQPIVAAETDETAFTATVENGPLFEEGDLVVVRDRQQVAVVRSVTDNDIQLDHQAGFAVKPDEVLVGANWKGALIPYSVFSFSPSIQIAWSRFTELLRAGDAVTVWDRAAGPLDPRPDRVSRVAAVGNGYFASFTALSDMAAGSSVVCGEFPVLSTVSDVDPDGRIAVNPAALKVGDWVAPLAVSPTGAIQLAQVTAAGSDGKVTLSQPIENLTPGLILGVVHFRESVKVLAVNPDDSLKLAEPLRVRPGDFVAAWHHHAENSALGIVRSIDAADGGTPAITIGPPDQASSPGAPAAEMLGLPGIVPKGLIDGGVLGLAALAPLQPAVRLEAG